MKHTLKFTMVAAATLMIASGAGATTTTVFDGIADGRADFDATVVGTGGAVAVDTWTTFGSGASVDRGDYTITRNNGGSLSSTTYGTMSGRVVDISPTLNSGAFEPANARANPLDYFDSGVTLTFDSAVNSVGFEVGDWATCCQEPTTDLFISFDGGTPIEVASASSSVEGLFPSQTNPASNVFEIFVAAFDDTGDFTSVSFWGNGLGEYLLFGGEVRYALIDQGSLPPNMPSVPLPAAGFLLFGGLAGLAGLRRRRKS